MIRAVVLAPFLFSARAPAPAPVAVSAAPHALLLAPPSAPALTAAFAPAPAVAVSAVAAPAVSVVAAPAVSVVAAPAAMGAVPLPPFSAPLPGVSAGRRVFDGAASDGPVLPEPVAPAPVPVPSVAGRWRSASAGPGALAGAAMAGVLPAAAALLRPIDRLWGLHAYDFGEHLLRTDPSLYPWFVHGWVEGMGTVFSFTGASVLARLAFPGAPRALRAVVTLALAAAMGASAMPAALSLAVQAAGEEAVFRGGVLGWTAAALERAGWTRRASWAAAALISSVVFSAAHILLHGFTVELFVLKAVLGLLLAEAYRRGGLPASAAAHIVYNALTVLFWS